MLLCSVTKRLSPRAMRCLLVKMALFSCLFTNRQPIVSGLGWRNTLGPEADNLTCISIDIYPTVPLGKYLSWYKNKNEAMDSHATVGSRI